MAEDLKITTLLVDYGKVLRDTSWSAVVERVRPAKPGLDKQKLYDAVFPQFKDYERGKYERLEFWSMVESALGLEIPGTPGEFLSDCYRSVLLGYNSEVIDVVANVHRQGLKTAIISNCCEEIADAIEESSRLVELFPIRIYSFKVGERKPHPHIFRAALQAAAALPEECLFIDDQQKNIEGAEKLNINSIRYENPERLRLAISGSGLSV